jgi:hypothetical protein
MIYFILYRLRKKFNVSTFYYLYRDDELRRVNADLEKIKSEKEALEKAYKFSLNECENLTNQRVRKFYKIQKREKIF